MRIATITIPYASCERDSRRFTKMKKRGATFYFMMASMLIRLFWLSFFEPRGAARAAVKTQQMSEFAQFVSTTIPFVVYPSIIALIVIIIFSLTEKRWAYLAGSIFGLAHFILIMALVTMHVTPGLGFLVVIPSSLGMMVFSYICYKNIDWQRQ